MNFLWDKELNLGETKTEILENLRKRANPNCNTCYGLGHVGYKEKKVRLQNGKIVKPRTYIICSKCEKKIRNAQS